ncbi:hypothetical protein [Acidomonas methanolica]|uniref:Uncharacterized protein n=1 Tax=Acidomonas methanolica NBRC 104435 TaxID=1231351 RepID=A0A023D6B8_ACIMT|nr:hypothetical protein [Acidomonas methanolica]TCS25085.1 hypothetical protein EDC31_1201 [Acidomonas methanolica]GAJ29672.1 hypothetical protein Amme_073_017 [Acidomonas methanolica NBRC 104435]GBQ60839.1 hypothetical protein AA0498_2877 [Acidomonas methanolica]GEK99827.1 hypothetical protein AME01nite_23260 [Acidomonas methanolica NBRC 104435]
MTNLHDTIQELRAELTSYGLSRRERAQITRELKQALAELAAKTRATDEEAPA